MRPDYLQTLEERKRRKKKMWTWGGFGLSVYCLSLLFLLLVLRTPLFEVNSIQISGAKEIPEKNILSLLQSETLKSWPNRFLGANNLLVWPQSFSKEELALIPSLRSVQVEKDYAGKKILIQVAERQPYGIWCLETKDPPDCFWFDQDGIMFKQAFSAEGNLIRVVKDYYQQGLGMNDSVLPPQFLSNLFPILDVLQKTGLSVQEVALRHLDLEEVEVTTFNGPKLFFSLRFPPQGALQVINSLKARGGFKNLSYIDFRVENRAYYK